MAEQNIYLSNFDIEDRTFDYRCRVADLRELLTESSQCPTAFGAAIEEIDFEELAITAMLKPFENLIKQLELGYYEYDCECGDDDCLEVTFSFESAIDAAMFRQAIHSQNLG